MARHASAAKRQEWEARFLRFERSGLSIREFCAAEDVPPGTFWYWRRSLRGAAGRRPRASKQARAAFTPVEIIAREPAAGIVIRLPRGALVELPADRPELLQAALSALTAESPAC
jgi:transposase-like protein